MSDPCEPTEPPGLENRPGLPALRYRVGTHSSLLAKMLQQLPRQKLQANGETVQPLSGLTARTGDDLSIALADAWATVGDVLSFYQERIANEGYLRTATERRSVLELARAIGYELKPGVAASTYLCFNVDEPVGPPGPVPIPTVTTVPKGTAVQSVPSQGELPQTFETTAAITARVEWNAIRARTTQAQRFSISAGKLNLLDVNGVNKGPAKALYLAGSATNLKAGDVLLARSGSAVAILAVKAVTVELQEGPTLVPGMAAPAKWTRVDLAGGTAAVPAFAPTDPAAGTVEVTPLTLTAENVKARIMDRLWDERDLTAFLAIQRWDTREVLKRVVAQLAAEAASIELFAFRQRSGFFGNTAPSHAALALSYAQQAASGSSLASKQSLPSSPAPTQSTTTVANPWPSDWDSGVSIWKRSDGFTYRAKLGYDALLERVVSDAAPGGWVVFNPGLLTSARAFQVSDAAELSQVDFGLTAKVSALKLLAADGTDLTDAVKPSGFDFRSSTAHVASEKLALSAMPVVEAVGTPATGLGATQLHLDRMVTWLSVGQTVVVTGNTVDALGLDSGVTTSEAVVLDRVLHARGYSTLYFATQLKNVYLRSSVVVRGNVAPATHGESTVREVLGAGDATLASQTFALKKAPLTYVPAATPSGGKDTLEVRVNGVLWSEVPSLYGAAPDSPSYQVRVEDDGSTTVQFGSGAARLPSGQDNVVARYRTGLGPLGELEPGRLSLLQSRPPGIKDVTQPLPATGSGSAESLADARVNAPRTVLTLDRVVSLKDHEDFARGFAGVAKAQATTVWSGERQVVHLTVAGVDGRAIPDGSDLAKNLTAGLIAASDGGQPVKVTSYAPRFFKVEARLVVDPTYETATVHAAAVTAITAAFSFAQRAFGQAVTEAEVLHVLQPVKGVVAVVLTALDDASKVVPGLQGVLVAQQAHWDGALNTFLPGELLLLHPTGLKLTEVAP